MVATGTTMVGGRKLARWWVGSLLKVLAAASFQSHASALHRLHHGRQDLFRDAHDGPPKASGELLWRLFLPRLKAALLLAQTPIDASPEPVVKGVEVRGSLQQRKDSNMFGSCCILSKK